MYCKQVATWKGIRIKKRLVDRTGMGSRQYQTHTDSGNRSVNTDNLKFPVWSLHTYTLYGGCKVAFVHRLAVCSLNHETPISFVLHLLPTPNFPKIHPYILHAQA
jgi:hypothetical protein